MNNSWGAGLAVASSMLYMLDDRHNVGMLSHRSVGHVRDGHLNHTLSSHILYPLILINTKPNADYLPISSTLILSQSLDSERSQDYKVNQ
jgi:hypothetical protein